MAKVVIKGIKGVEESTRKVLQKAINSQELLNEVAVLVQRNIIGSARQGKTQDGVALKPLSKSWVERRKKLSEVNSTGTFYKPSKSNLSFTGQLLDSFTYEISRVNATIRLFFKGSRKPYKGIKKAALEGPATNRELAEQIEQDRPFVFIGEKLNKIIVNKVKRSLRKQLSNFNKLRKILS